MRSEESCERLINSIRAKASKNNPLYNIVKPSLSLDERDYSLQNLNSSEARSLTESFSKFITNKYL